MVTSAEKQRVALLIKKRRQQLGIRTQADLAALVDVSETSVAKWESGKHYPARRLGKLEAVLGISLTEAEADPVEREIRELGARLGLAPGDQDAWIEIYRRRPPPAGERPARAAV